MLLSRLLKANGSPQQINSTLKRYELVRTAFHALDHKGSIDVKGLGVAMEMFGKQLGEAELKKLMSEIDTNHNDLVQFSEFARLMAKFLNEQRSPI